MTKDQQNAAGAAESAAHTQAALANFNNTVQQNQVPTSAYNVPPMMPIGGRGQSCISQPSGNGFITNCN
jgi:hypothetical protein